MGTTSVRTLESLYWFGVKLFMKLSKEFLINQWDPYEITSGVEISRQEALMAVLAYMDERKIIVVSGYTRLMIKPGYRFRVVDGMITNFHLPKSTLLLLVSAFVGEQWKELYEYALLHGFRFLSYGDSCLFL